MEGLSGVKPNIAPRVNTKTPVLPAVTQTAGQAEGAPSGTATGPEVKTVREIRSQQPGGSNPGASEQVTDLQGNTAQQVSGETVKKTTALLGKIKDNIGLVDVKVDKKNIIIDKPWPMKNDKVPIQEGKVDEAKNTVAELMQKFKGGQNPTDEDSLKVLNVIDQQKLMALMQEKS